MTREGNGQISASVIPGPHHISESRILNQQLWTFKNDVIFEFWYCWIVPYLIKGKRRESFQLNLPTCTGEQNDSYYAFTNMIPSKCQQINTTQIWWASPVSLVETG